VEWETDRERNQKRVKLVGSMAKVVKKGAARLVVHNKQGIGGK